MQIFLTGNSFRLRKCALRCPNYTLQYMIMYGRKAETSSEHASGIEERFIQEVRVNAVDRSQHTCYNCVFAYPRQAQPCPVKMQDAKFSSKKGRFSTVCRQKSSQYSIQSKTKGKTSKNNSKHFRHMEHAKAIHPMSSTVHDDNNSSDDEYMHQIICPQSFQTHKGHGNTNSFCQNRTAF